MDLAGNEYLVTGANSGIGYAAAKGFLERGGKVHMICRSKDRGEAARASLLQTTRQPEALVELHIVDMSSVRQIKAFCAAFCRRCQKQGKRLDCLVNNAGALLNELQSTGEGFEASFALNTLGTYVLTNNLLPALQLKDETYTTKSDGQAPARVIVVSSGGMYTQPLDSKCARVQQATFTDTIKTKWDGVAAYAVHKRQQAALTERWARIFKKRGSSVLFQSMHPGWVDTPGVETSLPGFYKHLNASLRSPEQGADTIVWLGASPAALQEQAGGFYLDRQRQAAHLFGSWTQYEEAEVDVLATRLDELAKGLEPSDQDRAAYAYLERDV